MQQEKYIKLLIFIWFFRDFTCPVFYVFAKIIQEMKKFLLFVCACLFCVSGADCAVRGENTVSRTTKPSTTTARATRTIASRTPLKTNVSARSTKPVTILMPTTSKSTRKSARSTTTTRNVSARTSTISAAETRTGIEYEQCKTAFFTCMDQFCQLKSDVFRRCSCSDRIFDFQNITETYQKANEQLSEFSENLDVVGMTKEQATAMKTASEGEDALGKDKTASKQLLQAIMNSIKGENAYVSGKYQDLNSIIISPDMSYSFGMEDSAQLVASYNGTNLYKAVFPKCRTIVQEDCNKASLQRAINAYLMSIEQDCNTVEAALQKQQKNLKAATYQSSAMLDLARVENRQKHNSDDVATCLENVESAIQSEEVCGSDYHKCLDYGQFIDITTGAPLTGVSDFYKLGELLTFKTDTDLKDQKLSAIAKNRQFVQFFEKKTKKFAESALDKCTENADFVWQQYLDKALLDIYYAQQDKVKIIKQSCLDLVANCYDKQNTSIANAMANLTGDSTLLLKPATISLTAEICSNYITSCNGMFNEDIIQAYMDNKDKIDSLNACRAIAKQCFDSFGGTGYGNFYYTQSGLFQHGNALDWFSLYEYIDDTPTILSPCAQQIANTPGCEDKLEEAFGGFNKYKDSQNNTFVYSAVANDDTTRKIRQTGVATEIYYQISDSLAHHCAGLGGYFVEYKYASQYGYKPTDFCKIDSSNVDSVFYINPDYNSPNSLVYWYHFIPEENMCPLNYGVTVDTQSWGLCSCWENGGYRSKNGTIATCGPFLPAISGEDNSLCSANILCSNNQTSAEMCQQPYSSNSVQYWCQQSVKSSFEQICPTMNILNNDNSARCADEDQVEIETVTYNVPKHKNLQE